MSNKAARAVVYIVCTPRPRVGKTLLARLATDYARVDGRDVSLFDVNPHDPILTEFQPRLSRIIDIQHTPDQMALFDALVQDDGVTKVVDLGHMSFQRFFTLAEQIEAFDETQRRKIEVMALMPIDIHPATRAALSDLIVRFPGVLAVPVENPAVAPPPRSLPPGADRASPFKLPMLDLGLRPFVTNPSRSFYEFHEQVLEGVPPATAAKLQDWTRKVFLEFRELELGLLLRKLRSSLLQAS